ncbi:MAG: hypothetical protein ACTH31_02700 [Pseudoclavibacter sp.]
MTTTAGGTIAYTQHLTFDGSRVTGPREGLNMTSLEGWRGRPGGQRQERARSGRVGTVSESIWPGGRAFTVVGYAYGRTPEMMNHHLDRLTAAFADPTREEVFAVREGGQTQWARARASEVTILHRDAPYFADFQAHFVADNPRRFGEEHDVTGTSSSMVIAQRGQWPAELIVTVRAAVAMPQGCGLRLLDKNGTERGYLRLNAIGANQRQAVYASSGYVRAGSKAGGLVPNPIHSGRPFHLPGGGDHTIRIEPIQGTGVVERVEFADTYM